MPETIPDKRVFENLQRAALDCGYILTSNRDRPRHFGAGHIRSEVASKFARSVWEGLCSDALTKMLSEIGLTDLLTTHSLHSVQKLTTSLLLERLRDLRPQDVKTEVLLSWMGEYETSSLSSVDGESGDSVAADPRNDATPDTSEKGVRDDA